jgi:hypothetical protein
MHKSTVGSHALVQRNQNARIFVFWTNVVSHFHLFLSESFVHVKKVAYSCFEQIPMRRALVHLRKFFKKKKKNSCEEKKEKSVK